jgi:hypothetical protein
MGCDIHAHIEVKLKGQWEHYSVLEIGRDYELFGKIAGVKRDGPPVVQPRGLPDDLTVVTRHHRGLYDSNGHHEGWLNASEMMTVYQWHMDKNGDVPPIFGYVFGNLYDQKNLDYNNVEDIRLVFWFDN